MSATNQRDKAITLSKNNSKEALMVARQISDPWFRAQALSRVARFIESNVEAVGREAAKAAIECDDDYKRSAVRAWEIAALAERNFIAEAREGLHDALNTAKDIQPASSRSEAIFLLLQAATRIDTHDARQVFETLKSSCDPNEHWRCNRAIRDGLKIISGELPARPFFW